MSNDAKAQLLAAARSGGAAAVRTLIENGGPTETLLVRTTMSLDLLQHRLTDNNNHSVEVALAADGHTLLSAPAGYGLEAVASNLGLEVVG